jgi:hypothetical protein
MEALREFTNGICGSAEFGDGSGDQYPNPAWPKLCPAGLYTGGGGYQNRDASCHDGPPDADGNIRRNLFANLPYVASAAAVTSKLTMHEGTYAADINGLADGTLRLRSTSPLGMMEANICGGWKMLDLNYGDRFTASTAEISSSLRFGTDSRIDQLSDGTLRLRSTNSLGCVEAPTLRTGCVAITDSDSYHDSWCIYNDASSVDGGASFYDTYCNCDGIPVSSTPSGGRGVSQKTVLQSPVGDSSIQKLEDGTLHLWSPRCVEVNLCKYSNLEPGPLDGYLGYGTGTGSYDNPS